MHKEYVKRHGNKKISEKPPVLISDSFSRLLECVKKLSSNSKIAIITDDIVGRIYLEQLLTVITKYIEKKDSHVYIMKHGEGSKNLDTVSSIYQFLEHHYFERKDIIFALGGGVVGDIAGFVAATFLRGIKFIQIPTTLLAQVDSSIGGKNGVNFNGIKNIVGTFYPPSLIYINIQVLNTLPDEEFRNGLAECLVHAIIRHRPMIPFMVHNRERLITAREKIYLEELIIKNIEIKLSVVEADEKEKGIRKILNFGHTIGHALESYWGYQYSHGQCVSAGIQAAYKIAYIKNLVQLHEVKEIYRILNLLDLPAELEKADWREVLELLKHDKKNQNGDITMILPLSNAQVVEYKMKLDESLYQILSTDLSQLFKGGDGQV